ncbi:alpha/beta fold hydrolase [Actinomadura macrotermitis]|nr:alpha/beta hydrolase [Actinomadura macrotermitis]
MATVTALLGATTTAAGAVAAAPRDDDGAKPTVVLVHGAFTDGSSWSGVIRDLHRSGYKAIAVADPLRDLRSDAAYVASVVASVKGPVVLVGHSYGGAVITNAAQAAPNVKALVYIAAFAPDEGESNASIGARFHDTIGKSVLPRPYTKPDGTTGVDLYIDPAKYAATFAADVPRSQTALMAATQRPITAEAVNTPSGPPAWKKLPSWYLVSTRDQAIPPAAQRFMAGRIGARTVELPASHASPVSRPRAVALLIRAAARNG